MVLFFQGPMVIIQMLAGALASCLFAAGPFPAEVFMFPEMYSFLYQIIIKLDPRGMAVTRQMWPILS